MKRLVVTYGEAKYPAERFTAIWKAVANVDAAVWAAAIERLIAEDAHPPMLVRITDVVRIVQDDMRARGDRTATEQRLAACRACGGTGWVVAVRRAGPHADRAFRCTCDAAARISKTYVAWSDDAAREWRPPWERAPQSQAQSGTGPRGIVDMRTGKRLTLPRLPPRPTPTRERGDK